MEGSAIRPVRRRYFQAFRQGLPCEARRAFPGLPGGAHQAGFQIGRQLERQWAHDRPINAVADGRQERPARENLLQTQVDKKFTLGLRWIHENAACGNDKNQDPDKINVGKGRPEVAWLAG